MNDFNDIHDGHEDFGPPPQDEFDSLLRDWHNENADRAAAGRDRLLQSLAVSQKNHDSSSNQATSDRALGRFPLRRIIMNRYSPAAAAMLLIGTLVAILNYAIPERAKADIIMLPEGGRLDALSPGGYVLGPCPLKHTDVDVDISGDFARVTLTQRFHNPYEDKIEAVYTFPMSHRAAVDRMTMTIGERGIIGEVHERQRARAIYEAAKQRGHVASLLEQERPNIFTQSVANIEPGTDVLIEISYVELLERHDGESSFNFPMVVGPRYVPGAPERNTYRPPHGLKERFGLILLAPAELTLGQAGDSATLGELDNEQLRRLIDTAIPIEQPAMNGSANAGGEEERQVWYGFEVLYPGVSQEFGVLYSDQTGQIAGRWFYFQLVPQPPTGTGFAPDTNQVPDASRITPIPTKPPTRAGHDISLTVHIDTGGPGIVDLQSALHEVAISGQRFGGDGLPQAETIELAGSTEIPNRDFILTWRQAADTITESILTHTGEHGNFFTLILQPPERVKDAQAVPRELIFVLDTSGSMSGFPIDKAKECMAKAMDGLRDNDTFNLITFAGDTHILWDEPRPGTWENIAEAQNFLASREGSGGTEMMTAINAALVRTWSGPITPRRLADLPADGRDVQVVLSPT
ncbi:MAG: VIT domain-containing protein, partial [Planctomycetota bacterium]